MKTEISLGKLRYLSFIFLDLICLIISNMTAARIYLDQHPSNYGYDDYRSVIFIMIFVDLLITFFFNTLNHVLRRRKRIEIIESARHVALSFIALAVILFSLRLGSSYSRVTVFLAYSIDFVLIVLARIAWSVILIKMRKKPQHPKAILMTTDRFVDEGLEELGKLSIDVEYIYLLKNINCNMINDIPVVKTREEAASAICWKMLDKVYIYGLDHQMVPEYLIKACYEMKLEIQLVDFNYRVIDVKTIQNEDPKYGTLSFLEGKRDIPFPIRRVYWITETQADLHRGFHAHKLNCQLLYCPYGKIDIILDDGQKRTTVILDEPGKGLILMPGLWREMVWQQSGSVLCVLASEYYDPEEYICNYDEFITYTKKYRENAQSNA